MPQSTTLTNSKNAYAGAIRKSMNNNAARTGITRDTTWNQADASQNAQNSILAFSSPSAAVQEQKQRSANRLGSQQNANALWQGGKDKSDARKAAAQAAADAAAAKAKYEESYKNALTEAQSKDDAQKKVAAANAKAQSSVQSSGGNSPTYNVPQGTSAARQKLVDSAMSLLGTPYAWGGGGYHNKGSHGVGKGTQNVIGVDCSGLTSYAYGTLGIKLARQSDNQLKTSGYKTAIKNLQPGDLVGWAHGGHVAMYIGNGQIIESPNVGKTVRIRKLYKGENVFGVHVNIKGG